MKQIEYKCKLCGKPGTAEFPEHAPQEAVDKWFPMLAHNRCADLRRDRDDSEVLIRFACHRIINASEEKKAVIVSKARIILERATKSYANSLAGILEREPIWSRDFVDLIIQQPEKVNQILSKYRDKIRAQPRRREGAD